MTVREARRADGGVLPPWEFLRGTATPSTDESREPPSNPEE